MEYREIEKTKIAPSLLGFGCMRFPKLADGKIDEAEAEKMMDKAIAEGVTYIDTAYPYHDGDSEPFVGRVLKKYDRSSFYLATKLPVWKVNSKEEAKKIFEEQLARLQVEYVDFYLLHALNKDSWQKCVDLDIVTLGEELKTEGKIKNFGFSFHDDYDTFEKIITYRDWDFCQIQYNYMDRDMQAGDKGYALSEKLGIPMVIMEPIKGGSLAALPDDITALFQKEDGEASTASWALRWVASHPNVKVVLSGMSTYEQVLNNLETFAAFKPLSEKEEQVVETVAATIKSRVKNGCTGCRYCMPCPFGIDIPKNFAIWNTHAMYGNDAEAKQRYFKDMEEAARADQCKSCGKCETLCPQALPIRENLKQAAADMTALNEV